MPSALALAAALAAATALGSGPAAPAGPVQGPAQALADAPARSATALRRYPAPQARQGVAVGAQFLYAVSNHEIVKYDKHSGERLGQWRGDPQRFPHINSCALIAAELVCASSNYPATPHWSSVEFFDPDTLDHLRSVSLGLGTGSLTWVDRKDGAWWALFANYDGRGGEAPRDHRHTLLVRLDEAWRRTESWAFPASVLERIAPSSISGGGWGPDGRLYATGHDGRNCTCWRCRAKAARCSTTWTPSASRWRGKRSIGTRVNRACCTGSAAANARSCRCGCRPAHPEENIATRLARIGGQWLCRWLVQLARAQPGTPLPGPDRVPEPSLVVAELVAGASARG